MFTKPWFKEKLNPNDQMATKITPRPNVTPDDGTKSCVFQY